MNKVTMLAALFCSMVLSACNLPAPDLSLLQAQCQLANASAGKAEQQYFIVSSSLPDCRGQRLGFTGFRNHGGLQIESPEGGAGDQINMQPTSLSFALSTLPETGDDAWELHDTQLFPHAYWQEELRARIAAPDNAGRLIIFIHGYNNSFEDALQRGHILRQIDGRGVPIVIINWPSRAKLRGYTQDEASIDWAQGYVSAIVEQMAGIATDITLISHSMGGRALIGAVERLEDRQPDIAGHVRRVVLAAPDVDRHRVLRENGALDTLLGSGREVLIYTSQMDLPIRLSGSLHGYSRLGTSDCRADVDYSRRQAGREGNCHWTKPRAHFQIVETGGLDIDGRLRHADVFDSCAGRYDLRRFLHGSDDFPWRNISTADGLAGAAIAPDYFRDRPELCEEVGVEF